MPRKFNPADKLVAIMKAIISAKLVWLNKFKIISFDDTFKSRVNKYNIKKIINLRKPLIGDLNV